MRLTITIDVPEALALQLVPESALGPYGEGGVKTKSRGSLLIESRLRWLPVGCREDGQSLEVQLTRELTPDERKAKLDYRTPASEISVFE